MHSFKIITVAALLGLSTARETYDYVIVGGGISGLVVANRLSENNKSEIKIFRYLNKANFVNFRDGPTHRSRRRR